MVNFSTQFPLLQISTVFDKYDIKSDFSATVLCYASLTDLTTLQILHCKYKDCFLFIFSM
jgi:hypothetical protein